MIAPGVCLVVAAGVAGLGLAWAALSQDEHWARARPGQALGRRRRAGLRMAAVLALALAGGLCAVADRPSIALLVWVMLLAGGTVAVAGALAAWPRGVGRLAGPAGGSGAAQGHGLQQVPGDVHAQQAAVEQIGRQQDVGATAPR